MALIANNISGSISNASRIGITGSVIIANRPGSSFPTLPGSDVVFFVSGSSIERSVFGGDVFVTGSITVGTATGTSTITLGQSTVSNTISIGSAGNNTSNLQTINVGAGTGTSLISIGTLTGTGTTTIRAGSTGMALTGSGNFTMGGAPSSTITIGAENQTGTITIGQSTGTSAINMGTGTGISLITIGNLQSASGLILQTGTSNMLLTGSATATYTLGGETGTGTITIGRSTAANIINIGSAGNNTANMQMVNIASGSGGSAVIIGSDAAHTGKTSIRAGTSSGGGVVLAQSGGRLGFFGLATPVTVQTVTDISNNVTSGGTSNTLTNYTNLTTYSSDASTIKGNFYQIGVKLNAIIDALQAYGLM